MSEKVKQVKVYVTQSCHQALKHEGRQSVAGYASNLLKSMLENFSKRNFSAVKITETGRRLAEDALEDPLERPNKLLTLKIPEGLLSGFLDECDNKCIPFVPPRKNRAVDNSQLKSYLPALLYIAMLSKGHKVVLDEKTQETVQAFVEYAKAIPDLEILNVKDVSGSDPLAHVAEENLPLLFRISSRSLGQVVPYNVDDVLKQQIRRAAEEKGLEKSKWARLALITALSHDWTMANVLGQNAAKGMLMPAADNAFQDKVRLSDAMQRTIDDRACKLGVSRAKYVRAAFEYALKEGIDASIPLVENAQTGLLELVLAGEEPA